MTGPPDSVISSGPGALTWRPEWRQHLAPFPVIYLLGDADRAGREMNSRVKRDVPWARPVRLPDGEDARSTLQTHGTRALDPFLRAADSAVRLEAAILLAHNIEECQALLRGEDVQH